MKPFLALSIALVCCRAAIADEAVSALSKFLGKTPALVVVACRGDDRDLPAIAAIVEETPWTVLCRDGASPAMEAIRDWAREKGILGGRVCVADGPGESLWLASDMADAVWVAAGADLPPPEGEILRVLRPGGVCVASGKVVVKPAPPGLDQWRHPYHGPDNNVVSQDRVARLPGELRFQTHPVFAAMPNQSLFAGGRIFFFSGHIAFHEREEPLLNTLTVLNAYNGLRLWSRPLDPNYVVHDVAKQGDGVFADHHRIAEVEVHLQGGAPQALDDFEKDLAALGKIRALPEVILVVIFIGDPNPPFEGVFGGRLQAFAGPGHALLARDRGMNLPGGEPDAGCAQAGGGIDVPFRDFELPRPHGGIGMRKIGGPDQLRNPELVFLQPGEDGIKIRRIEGGQRPVVNLRAVDSEGTGDGEPFFQLHRPVEDHRLEINHGNGAKFHGVLPFYSA